MIEVLKNPLTPNYLKLKEIILSDNFHWENIISTMDVVSNTEGHIHMPVDIHTFIPRPETTREDNSVTGSLSKKIGDAEGKSKSEYVDLCVTVMTEILDYSNLFGTYIFHRAATNRTHSGEGIQLSEPHIDHNFPHNNLLVYLTNSGGETFVEGEKFNPKEDDVIVFEGEHYMKRPIKDRRVVLVSTFMPIPSPPSPLEALLTSFR
tara:strand:+ start:65 stop:682 length:618 start_codon:yes stop_codon:yes gene_type:complete